MQFTEMTTKELIQEYQEYKAYLKKLRNEKTKDASYYEVERCYLEHCLKCADELHKRMLAIVAVKRSIG